MLLAGALLVGWAAAKSPAEGLEMVVRLANTAVVPVKALRQAESTAGGILARAGVRVVWVDCAVESCARARGYLVQFVERQPPRMHAETAGYAVVYPEDQGTGGYAVVAWRQSAVAAAEFGLEAGPLLGAAIAHEIGHLLLGSAHSRNGVMMARFRRREMEMAARGELGFLDDQVQRIHAVPALRR
jgi:hypothetical protein